MKPGHRLLLATALALQVAVAADAEPRPVEAADVLRIRQVADPQVSPDGHWVAYTVRETDLQADRYVSHVWMASWDGQQQVQVTHGPSSSSSPRWSPDGRYLSFVATRSKQAGPQLWLLDRRGGEAKAIESLRGDIDEYAWAPDASRLAVVMRPPPQEADDESPRPIVINRYHFKNDEDGYLQDTPPRRIHIFEISTGQLTTLTTPGSYEESDPAWSPDGRRIAFVSNRDPAQDRVDNSDVWVASIEAGAPLRQLTTNPGQDNGPLAWSPDGREVAYRKGPPLDNWLYHFHEPAIVSAEGGESRFPAVALDRDGNQLRFSDDGRYLDFLVTDTGWVYPARVAVNGGAVRRTLDEPYFIRTQAQAGGHVAMLASTDTSPFEIHALEAGKLRKLTHHNDAWLSQVQLASTEDIHFAGKDGVSVQGLLTRPSSRRESRHPLVLWIHGGPYGQDRHSFDFERQLFAAQGYAVLQINYRGSSGRGVQFARTIHADWGNQDLSDLLAGVDRAIGMGVADETRLAVGGWSQGGILTNFVIAHDARFKAAIAGAGAANQLGLYGADPYILVYDHEFRPPWVDPDRWLRLSYPFFHADRIRTPTLYVGGEKDFNVPIIGSEQMYQALKSLGVPTRLVIYPGQHHSFSRPSFQRDLLQRYVDWYATYLSAPAGR